MLRVHVLAAALMTAAGSVLAADPLPVASSGKSLVLPETQRALGTVYYALPGGLRQVSFESAAPVEKVTGNSNQVIGYAIAGPADNPAKLQGGEWHLPVASLRTGNAERDTHLTQDQWFDASKHPSIVFTLKEVKDAKDAGAGKDTTVKRFVGTLVGDMTIKGVTKPMAIENAIIAYRASSNATQMIADGDILLIQATYKIKLEDFGIKNETITTAKKVAEEVSVKTDLWLSSVAPEQQTAKAPPQPKAGAATPQAPKVLDSAPKVQPTPEAKPAEPAKAP